MDIGNFWQKNIVGIRDFTRCPVIGRKKKNYAAEFKSTDEFLNLEKQGFQEYS